MDDIVLIGLVGGVVVAEVVCLDGRWGRWSLDDPLGLVGGAGTGTGAAALGGSLAPSLPLPPPIELGGAPAGALLLVGALVVMCFPLRPPPAAPPMDRGGSLGA